MAEEQNPAEGLPNAQFIRPASTDIENYLPVSRNRTPDDELYNPFPVRQPDLSRQGLPGNSSNIQQYAVKDKVTGYPPFSPNQLPQSNKKGDRVTDHINSLLQKRAQSTVDNNVYAKPFMYDATASGANKARYKAYGQKTYDRVGFNPEINNEEVFNANTSMLDDYIRMGTHAFLPMFGNGLFANPRSYGQFIAGDIGQDLEAAEKYENYNNLGYSTKGGVFGFINNLFNSVAYSAGVMAETAAEMALIGAIEGSIVGPEGTVAGGAVGGAVGAVKGLFSLPKSLYNMGKFGGAMLKNVQNLERFNAAQRMFVSASKTTVNFFNPLENTVGALKSAYGEANNLTNLARASKSAAGFFRDVSFINSAFSEGRLEGGMVENNAYRKGYDRFWKEKNRAPNEQEQLDLRKTAKLAGFQDTWKNGLLVMYSNKVAFPNLFRGNMLSKFTHNVSRFGDEFDIMFKAAKKDAAKAGEDATKKAVAGGSYELVDFNFKNALKGLIRPANLGKASLNYFKTNLMEGTQEVLQDVIADSTEKYYLDAYFDKSKQNFDYSMGALRDAFSAQAGERGFENLASGFFMGMLMKPFNGAVPRYASMMYTKATTSAQEYEKHKTERQEYGQRVVNAMNRMNQNPADFLNDRMVNYGVASKLSKVHNADDTTTKEHKDAVQAGFTSDVLTVLSSGTFDIWKKNFSRFNQLNEKELEEAFDLEAGEGTKAKKMLDDYLKKGDKLQERFNYTMKTVGSKKADLSKLKEGTPEHDKATIYNKALDRSIYNMIFIQDSFDNNLERLSKMYRGWSALDPNSKLPGFDFQNLTDPGLLQNNIDMLTQEVEAMKQSIENTQPNLVLSSKIQEKQDLLNDLIEFSKSQNDYVKAAFKNEAFKVAREKYMKDENLSEGDAELKAFDEVANDYIKSGVNPEEQFKNSYKNLLQRLAGSNVNYQKVISSLKNKSFDDLFNDLKDIHVLNNENAALTPYINLLLDTDGFFEHVNRNFQWMSNLWNNRKEYYKDVVNKSIELKEYNDLLKSLSDKNIYVDLEQFADWIEDKNNLPDYFIDATAGAERIIPKDSMLYGKYVEEFERLTSLQEEKPAGNPADLKSQMDQEIELLEEKKSKELDDAELNFKNDIQEERGAPLEQLRETEAKSKEAVVTESEEDPTQTVMDKFAEVIELIESPDLNKVFDAYKIIWQRSLIDIDQFKGDIKNFEKFFTDRLTKIYKDKKRMAEEVMPLAESYDWSNEEDKVNAALYNATIMDLINEEIENARKEGTETVAAEPVILVENSESWKDYQAVIQEIEERYAKLIEDVTRKYTEQGLKPDGVEKITINTDFDSIPDDNFKTKLTGLFDEYLKERGQDNLLAEDPDEYVRLRANWFREQGELIEQYNAGKAAEAIKKEREASILTEPKLLYYKSDGDMVSKPLSYLNDVLDGLLYTKESGKKLNNKKELVDLTEKEIANLNNDIAAIEELIEKKRNISVPVSNFDKAYDTFKQRILDRQAEVEQILDPEGKVTERRLDGKTPERVTNIAEDLDLKLTPGKKKYKYSPLDASTKKVRDAEGNVIDEVEIPSPVLEVFNLINNDDAIKPEAKADKFIEKFLQLKYPAFEETTKNKITGKKVENPKTELLRKSLKEDFSEENVVNTIQRLSSKEASDVGDQMDVMIKTFLTREGTGWKKLNKPDNMPQEVFDNIFGTRGFITRFRDTMIDGNYMIIGASTLLFDGTIGENGLAGETDLIAIDADGNFNIIDIKALTKDKWDVFHGDVRYKRRVAKLTKEGATEEEIAKDKDVITFGIQKFKSKKQYFRLQQSIYRNLFYNMTGQMPKRIGLLPIEVEYDKLGNIVSAKLSELVPEDQTTIELFYMPEVETRVPLKAPAVAPTTTAPVADIEAQKADIEKRARVTDIITSQLELGVELPKILETLADQGYVEKINGSAFFKQTTGRDAVVFNIDGAIIPVYRSSKGTSSKTKGKWYPFFFNAGDWLVKAGADTYKNGYNNSIINQILEALNKNYTYDKSIATVEGNNNQILSLLGMQDLDVSDENNSGIYDYRNYGAIAIILKDWQNKLGKIDVTGYQEYLDGASSSLIKANPTLKSDIESAFDEVSKLFSELAALEQSTEPVYEVVKPKSKKLSDTVGQTVVYQGEIGELILNSDGTYGLKLQDNTVKTITYAIKDVTDGKVTFDQAGILPVQEIKSFGQISVVNGVELDAEFLNDEESKATVNGVLYTVDRNEFGNIESLTYESNAKEISDTQDKISEIEDQINTLREDTATKTTQDKYDQLQARVQELTNAINNTENEDVIQRLTKKRIVISGQFQQLRNAQNANIRKIAQLEIELKTLEAKVNNLQATNYKRTLSGGNANDIIFALNSLPNSFQKKAVKLKPAAQEQILKTIAAESTSPTASSKIDEVFEDMPFSVDKLWAGGINAINATDLAEIKDWSNTAIQKLTNLQSELSNRGDLFDDVTNQINTISNFISQLSLIKLNKDGKISKKQPKEAREAFTPETGNAPSETKIPTSGPAEGSTGQATGAKPTTDQMKAALRGINATADDLLQGITTEEGEAESIDKTAEFISAMNEAKSDKELDEIYYNALKEIDQNPANATFISLNDAYKKATERLALELYIENAKNDGYIILKDDNFGYAKGSVWTVVKENQDGSLDIQDIDGLFEKTIKQEELQKNFSRINEESMKQPDIEISEQDQEIAKDTTAVVENLLADSQALKNAEQEVEQAETKGSFRDKLKKRKCNI